MKILNLWIKQPDHRMVACSSVNLVSGYGIEGDQNARVGSPRQVLLVDQPSLQLFGLQPGDLSENILVDQCCADWTSGQILNLGGAFIRLTFLCEPCFRLESIHPGLVRQIKGRRGCLGMVVKSGSVTVGDGVTPTGYTLPAIADNPKDRFQALVARIPPGKVMTTADLVLALGVSDAYYRVIPTFIKQSLARLPVHRIVAANGTLLLRHIPDQAERLMREGVDVVRGRVGDRDRWQPEHFYGGLPLSLLS
jgi:alkylated DNA nucleotide flippase Atl1